jgi:hypothetical protein
VLEGFDFGAILTAGGLAKLGQIIVGDLTMAGDNVVIMGSLASGLPARDRRKVLMLPDFLRRPRDAASQDHRPRVRWRPAPPVGRLQHVAGASPEGDRGCG